MTEFTEKPRLDDVIADKDDNILGRVLAAVKSADNQLTAAEIRALEAAIRKRAHDIQALTEKISDKLIRINTTEQILNKYVGEVKRLRKNLYGLLNSTKPESIDALFEEEDRMKIQSMLRRYAAIGADDLITQEQLRDVRAAYQKEGEIEIDEDALVSADQEFHGGYWVQAWVWWIPSA